MKKLLIILTFCFSTIFFVDNVSAATVFDITSIRSDFVLPGKVEDFGTYQNNYDRAMQYYLNNCVNNYDSYIITNRDFGYGWGDNQVNLVCFNSSTNEFIPSLNIGLIGSSTIYLDINIYKGNDYLVRHFYNTSSSTSYTYSYGIAMELYSYKNIATTPLVLDNGIMATNLNFIFTNNRYKLNSNSTPVDTLIINDTTYNNNDLIYENGDVLPTTPTVSITKESETTVTIDNETFISSVTLNIDFSIVDNENYLYMYKYGINSDWSTITLSNSNSLSLTYNYNDTLYSQVVDRETNEVVSSTTYTVSSINYNFMPYVDVTENTPSSCFFYKNGRSYTICKDINIVAKNLEDGNFIASYSYDANNWVNFENTTISLNENTIIYFRITNYLTNEISYISTYTVSSIDTDISDLGVFNTYSSIYDKDTSFITAYINIYNLIEPVQDNYKIYYSTNSTSFIDITLLLTDMTNYYQYEINNINENKTIYFKITDLNDNILYTSSYTINYQIQANENSNFFTSFRTNFHGLSDIISTPLYAIKKLNTGVCSPLEIPIPYTNTTISLPCMTTVYQNNIPDILNIWQIVTNGIISYYIILDLFRIVKSFKEPEEDKIEVVDL